MMQALPAGGAMVAIEAPEAEGRGGRRAARGDGVDGGHQRPVVGGHRGGGKGRCSGIVEGLSSAPRHEAGA